MLSRQSNIIIQINSSSSCSNTHPFTSKSSKLAEFWPTICSLFYESLYINLRTRVVFSSPMCFSIWIMPLLLLFVHWGKESEFAFRIQLVAFAFSNSSCDFLTHTIRLFVPFPSYDTWLNPSWSYDWSNPSIQARRHPLLRIWMVPPWFKTMLTVSEYMTDCLLLSIGIWRSCAKFFRY